MGPNPFEHLLAALGACTVMTLRMYANHKKIQLDDIEVTLSHSKDYHDGTQKGDEQAPYSELINRKIKFIGDISEEQRDKLLVIANKCPVHKTLHSKLVVVTTAE